MSDIWITSDTHFGHENIIRFANRPFKDAAEMDAALVERWNSVVKPEDKVYHLGDVFFAKGWMCLPLLNGKKRLVLGNHDDAKHYSIQKHFQKVVMWRDFREFGILLTHVPVHPAHIIHGRSDGKLRVNVHGHLHNKKVLENRGVMTAPSRDPRYRCVCVEQTNYTPINIEELRV